MGSSRPRRNPPPAIFIHGGDDSAFPRTTMVPSRIIPTAVADEPLIYTPVAGSASAGLRVTGAAEQLPLIDIAARSI